MKNIKSKKVVCLGGGIGTVNLIKGLVVYTQNITAVVSMADSGGSSGRLRRAYNIPPPGDMISCMSAVIKNNEIFSKILTYRFPGDRYGRDDSLSGQRLGNLLMVGLRDITGSFEQAILELQKIFDIPGSFLPATVDPVDISAKTTEGKEIFGEEKIDLGKYNGQRTLDKLFLHPHNPKVSVKVIEAIKKADIIIAGPGDLYTTILPVLIIPEILMTLVKSKAKKLFIINIANKPFETKGYKLSDYVEATTKHLNSFPFGIVVANNNYSAKIPGRYKYNYVQLNNIKIKLIKKDLVNKDFPIYHSPEKLAKTVIENI